MTHELPEAGTRIRLIEMPQDPCPIEPGSLGTITFVRDSVRQIGVKWDCGRTLMLAMGVDKFEIVTTHRVIVLEDNAYARYDLLVEATDPDQAAGIGREMVASGDCKDGTQHFREDGGLPYVTDVIDAEGDECAIPDEHEWFGVHCPSAVTLQTEVAAVALQMAEFDMRCEQAQHTDIGKAWELMHAWRERLMKALPDNARTDVTAEIEALEDELRREDGEAEDAAQYAMTVSA